MAEPLSAATVAAWMLFVHTNYSPVPPKPDPLIAKCHQEVQAVPGVPSGWASVVTCPDDPRAATIRDPANAKVAECWTRCSRPCPTCAQVCNTNCY